MEHTIKTLVLVTTMVLLASCVNRVTEPGVRLTHGVDESAGGLHAYVIHTNNAVFFLEKSGGGLSSMVDNEGIDWLGFHNKAGSGWKGEYRGFPNAVHKQDGNYFHAMNAGTDPATSEITVNTPNHVQILFTSDNGKWEGRWDFYPDRCDFTMSKVSPGYHYWVQYEGVPGGAMDEGDFWYNSASLQRHSIYDSYAGDLPGPEWYAFGDKDSPRVLYLLNHNDDAHPDDYVSRPYMTVLGFGRQGKNKFLTAPSTFSIGFIESSSREEISEHLQALIK
ncbi:hypothetical protein [Gilvimarinus chinensis]|uniref:hypothetical protein n=1 Tax=Gilvimarinus chinensis TaxID=396005 RepID=UPI00037D033C|nr:hypothetical protein [Gilvimarinus chinensis]